MTVTTYVALLRGIGPLNPNMRNEKLRGVFEQLGFGSVRTVITTGNVIFESGSTDVAGLESQIEAAWPVRLGFTSCTIVRTADEIRRLIAAKPFGDRQHDATTSLDVTFLQRRSDVSLDLPYTSELGDFQILAMADRAIYSVIDRTVTPNPGIVRWIERHVGKQVTMRTWATVHRIARRLD